MFKHLSRALLFVLTVFSCVSNAHEASRLCQQVFMRSSGYEFIFVDKDLRQLSSKDSLTQLLQLANQSRFVNLGKKITLEKGEFILGFDLGNRESLELVYSGDKRDGVERYILTKVDFIHKNAVTENISRFPLNNENLSFSQKGIVFDSKFIKLPVREVTVEVPSVIYDQQLADFLKFANRMEFLTREDIDKAIEKKDIKGLTVKSNIRRIVKFIKFDSAKQTFRNVVFGGIIFLATHMAQNKNNDQVTPPPPPVPPIVVIMTNAEATANKVPTPVEVEKILEANKLKLDSKVSTPNVKP